MSYLSLSGFGLDFPIWGLFLEAPGNYQARQAVLVSIPDGSFKRFENCTVKLSAKETKWTSKEVRTHPTFLENLILKLITGPVKLPGLSRNGPLDPFLFCSKKAKKAKKPDKKNK